MRTRLSVATLSLSVIAAASMITAPRADADTIHLRDGRVLDGRIVSASPSTAPIVDIQLTSGSYIAIVHVAADQILRIDRGPSPHEQALADLSAREQRLADNGTSQDYIQLAHAAARLDEGTMTRRFATQALTLDPDNVAAHQLLGQVKQNGVWMSPAEAAAARGEVYFRGHWVPRPEMDALLTSEQHARHEADLARQARATEREVQRSYASDDFGGYVNSYGYDNSYGYGGYGYGFGYPIVILPNGQRGFHHHWGGDHDGDDHWIASRGGFRGGFSRGGMGGSFHGRR